MSEPQQQPEPLEAAEVGELIGSLLLLVREIDTKRDEEDE